MTTLAHVGNTTVRVGLNTCAELSIIDLDFAKNQKLQQASLKSPPLRAFEDTFANACGAYQVPVTATDNRGVTRTWTVICCAIKKKSGLPILIGMPSLHSQHITIDTGSYQWHFGAHKNNLELLTPHKFAKCLKDSARVFALVAFPKTEELDENSHDEPLPPMPPRNVTEMLESLTIHESKTEDLPPEFRDFIDLISTERSKTLPSRKETDHAIDLLPDTSPPYGPIYPLSRAELKELWEYLQTNLKAGRIRPSKSPAGAPILFVPKKDGGLRLCVDYRGLNRISVKNRYPLPLVSEILDRLARAKYFSKIDVQDAYYRIRIKEGDEWKTAFRTRYGHFEYTVMPFGLTNAPASFQNYMHIALRGYLDVFCVAYLDDILIFSPDRESHTEHVRLVLERLRQYELYIKPSKCAFYQERVEFLGYIVDGTGVSMDPTRVEAIKNWPLPTSVRDIQVFLGFCNFYRRFIYNYSSIVRSLTDLTKGSKNGKKPGRITLDDKAIQSFHNLLLAFQTAPVLRHFDPERPIRLETDASQWGMAGILSQPDDQGIWHPVAFWSRKFTETESRYTVGDQELFAIVHSFKVWRHYLEGSRHQIDVFSDHNNLKLFMQSPRLHGRQARWCMALSTFDFVIRHRAGKMNPADGPSRMMGPASRDALNATLLNPLSARMATEEEPERDPPAAVQSISLADLYQFKEELTPEPEVEETLDRSMDTWRQELGRSHRFYHEKVRQHCQGESACVASVSTELKSLIQEVQRDDPETGKIRISLEQKAPGLEHWSVDSEGVVRFKESLYIPSSEKLKSELIKLHHDDPITGGHFGRQRTTETLRSKYFWTNIHKYVDEYVKSCPICQATASPRHRKYGKLVSLPIPYRPWQETSMDFITGLPPTIHNGIEVDSILVIVDRFTKFCHFFPVHTTMTAAELAELYHNKIELKYGPQEGIVSDRGPVFTSKFWTRLFALAKTRLRFSTAFHPQTDSQTERVNQVIEHYLRCFTGEDQTVWPSLLNTAEFCCNSHKNSTTSLSPMQALMGYETSFHLRDGAVAEEKEMPEVEARLEKLAKLREKLTSHWREANESMAKHYNAKHKPITFKRNELVSLSTRNLRIKTCRKLSPKWIGPFKILEPIGNQAYRLALPEKYSRLHNVFNVSLLEKWHDHKERSGDETMPMPDLDDDDQEYEVEEVKGEHKFDGQTHFLVKWKGWPSEYNEWVPEYDMGNAKKSIADYRRKQNKGFKRTKG